MILTGFVLAARPIILAFGSAELFMLAVLGLSMVGVLSGSSLAKGVAAAGLGLVLGSVGAAPATGEFRLVFGMFYLYDGLPLVVVGLGIFAFPEIVDLLRQERSIAKGASLGAGWLAGLRDMIRNWFLWLRCSAMGTLIGAIPGLGGSVVDWIAYGHVVQTSRDKSRFGSGDIRGVIAPESANNAKEGGGLMPTLLFGIPGSGSMAIFLGGMVLLGIQPGPSMVSTHLGLTYTIIWSLALANVLGTGICLAFTPQLAKIATLRIHILTPLVVALVFLAAFQATRHIGDLLSLMFFSLLGWSMKRFGWPRPPLILGLVLSTIVEKYLFISMKRYGFAWLGRPAVWAILALTIFSLAYGFRRSGKMRQAKLADAGQTP